MGIDRFANFLSKSINNNGIDEQNINDNNRKIISNHIVFDINFLIYQEIIEIENEINDIIKIILTLPFSINSDEFLEKIITMIFIQPHWIKYYSGTELDKIFDGYNEEDIIQNFISYITTTLNKDNISIIELVIFEKINLTIINNIEKLHPPNFIQSLLIFFDGIPSISKVIEQRKRRIKNNLESYERKSLFKYYFDNLETTNKDLLDNLSKFYINKNILDNLLLFDYFKWLKHRFTINKSFGPASKFIKNLESFTQTKMNLIYPKIKIYINSAKENGEADLKIFKFISENDALPFFTGDYCIHTTDSDLIHQILVQQTYYKIINKDINLVVIKYIKNYNLTEYVQIIEAPIIIKHILELYNSINQIKITNYKIIWDLCLFFYFFGNDHLPSSYEIGPELGLDYYLKTHYESLDKKTIVNFKNGNITVDLNNLLLYLNKFKENNNNNITRILLQRFFKINNQLINLFTDKFKFDFKQILVFLKIFIINRAMQLSVTEFNELDEDDLRKIYYQNIENPELYNDFTILNLENNNIKILKENIKLIEKNIDYYEKEFMGLVLYKKPIYTTINQYQDIYHFILDKTNQNLTKTYPKYYEYININDHINNIDNACNFNSNDYLKKLFHNIITQFGNMKDYHTDNLTFYKYINIPPINELINYLELVSKDNNQTIIWEKEIKEDNISQHDYLNNINHHLLITPHILSYNSSEYIKNIIKEIGYIPNLWNDNNDGLSHHDYTRDFDYRNIDIKLFLKKYADALIKIKINTNDELILFEYNN
jgi:hypothetical protein